MSHVNNPERFSVSSRIPARVSLTVAMLFLLFIGMVSANAAVTLIQWTNSVRSVDMQLQDARYGWASHPGKAFAGEREDHGPMPPSRFFLRMRLDNGDVRVINDYRVAPELDNLPADNVIRTVGTKDSNLAWRVVRYHVDYLGESPAEGLTAGTVTLALPIGQQQLLLRNLIIYQIIIGVSILIAAGGFAWIVVDRAFEPLDVVEETAASIADGNYDQRVPTTGGDTEGDRLAQSFNRMADSFQEASKNSTIVARQARASEESMRQFVGDASHELRTPLTAIRGYAETALMGALDSHTALERIDSESKRMQRLVEDLLLLSRIDNKRPHQNAILTEIELEQVVTSAVEAARVSWQGRQIHLTIMDNAVVVGDENQIRQIIDNLLTNALRHAGDEAEVFVCQRKDARNEEVLLAVRDNGCGMDEHTAQHVFDRFYRGDYSRSRSKGDRSDGRGSGLGLAIVKSLVEVHGGHVTVTSHPGEGSEFVVTLPLAIETD